MSEALDAYYKKADEQSAFFRKYQSLCGELAALYLKLTPEDRLKANEACDEWYAREKYKEESRERQSRLKEATGESQNALLKAIMDARMKRPNDHGMLPGR